MSKEEAPHSRSRECQFSTRVRCSQPDRFCIREKVIGEALIIVLVVRNLCYVRGMTGVDYWLFGADLCFLQETKDMLKEVEQGAL